MACSRDAAGVRRQPVFCLLQVGLRESLRAHLGAGQRKVDGWTARHRCVEVVFDDEGAFVNINTLSELQPALPGQAGAPPPR
jgi:molybdopterin-guanine dinucleotide biosynthesis protein A